MKTFDWEYLKNTAQPMRYEWMKANYNKHITEDAFISAMIPLKVTQKGNPKNTSYRPSKLKRTYKNLKEKFGFFV